MPDRRRHRGPDPSDGAHFQQGQWPRLREAVDDLSWLLGRGYAHRAASTLVGDRFQLPARQRLAVERAACAPEVAAARRAKTVDIPGRAVRIDGFNVIVTVESALGGAPVLACRDGRLRDLARLRGTYRIVDETEPALDRLVAALAGCASAVWLLDRPVSNSGRLAALLRARGQDVQVMDAVDRELVRDGVAVASSDGPVIDRADMAVALDARALDGVEVAGWVDLG